jgi:exodeoxyribonuclease VII large subunit
VERAGEAMLTLAEGGLRDAAARLDHARSRLRLLTPAAQIEQGYLRLDDCANRLAAALRDSVRSRRHDFTELRAAFERHSPEKRVQDESHRLLSLWKRLQAASPASVLNRGFAIVRDENGKPVTRKSAVAGGQRLANQFADGEVRVTAD